MLKVCFTSAPSGLKERYGAIAPAGSNMPSLALLSLAAVARKSGFKANIIQAGVTGSGYKDMLERIFRHSPDCLAISATTFSINQAHDLAKLAKKINNDLTILIGGHHISALPSRTMEDFPGFDIGVMNEGEATLSELLVNLDRDRGIDDIKGIAFRKNGRVRLNPARQPIDNLDDLPMPAWDLLDGFPDSYYPPFFRFKRLPAASIVTSRGCPSRCTFCSKAVFGNQVRFFSPGYVFSMMSILHEKHGINDILIEDDTFTINKGRVNDICEFILESGMDINWSCLARADNIDSRLLNKMKRSGCWQISFGIESGSQEILDNVRKGVDLGAVRKAVKAAETAGISTKGFFILGLPGDNCNTIEDTIQFARKSALSDISVSFMTPFPGTQLYNNAGEFGEFDNDWRRMNLLNIVFIPRGMTRKGLKKYAIIFMRGFYLRPRIVYLYFLRIIFRPAYYGRAFKSLIAFLKTVFTKLD